jgi:hypothetical protein
MNTLELSQAIGKTGLLRFDALSVSVKIMDAKTAYGNVRYLVTPVSGTGSVWVDSSRVSFENSKEEKENAI